MTVNEWQFYSHLQHLQDEVLDVLSSETKHRLIIQMPVQHGKSWFCSFILPAWYLLSFPSRSLILATHGDEFSGRWGWKILNLIREHGKRLTGVTLHPDMQSRNLFALSNNSSFRGVGVGGSISGTPGHLIICDDLVKDQSEANSPSRRDSMATWFSAELLTRLQKRGKVIIVMSRRHPDDITGRLLASNNTAESEHDIWHTVHYPAITWDTNNEPHALCEDLHPARELLGIKRDNEAAGTTYVWECLYQQNPIGDPSSMEWPIEYFEGMLYREQPYGDEHVAYRVLSLDPAKGNDSKTGDYSSLLDVTLTNGGDVWVTDGFVRVVPIDQVVEQAATMLGANKYDAFIAECNGFQERVATEIIRLCEERRIPTPLVIGVENQMQKVARIRTSLTPILAKHKLHIKQPSVDLNRLYTQLQQFPSGSHDDAPDSLELATQAFNYLLGNMKKSQTILRS